MMTARTKDIDDNAIQAQENQRARATPIVKGTPTRQPTPRTLPQSKIKKPETQQTPQ
jgi:hypothetical protein